MIGHQRTEEPMMMMKMMKLNVHMFDAVCLGAAFTSHHEHSAAGHTM